LVSIIDIIISMIDAFVTYFSKLSATI
jgi:hypothetical protein